MPETAGQVSVIQTPEGLIFNESRLDPDQNNVTCKHDFRLVDPYILTEEMQIGPGLFFIGAHRTVLAEDPEKENKIPIYLHFPFTSKAKCQICGEESKWFLLRRCPICGQKLDYYYFMIDSPQRQLPKRILDDVFSYLFNASINIFLPEAAVSICTNNDCPIKILCGLRENVYEK
jgi:hypothetical protein